MASGRRVQRESLFSGVRSEVTSLCDTLAEEELLTFVESRSLFVPKLQKYLEKVMEGIR